MCVCVCVSLGTESRGELDGLVAILDSHGELAQLHVACGTVAVQHVILWRAGVGKCGQQRVVEEERRAYGGVPADGLGVVLDGVGVLGVPEAIVTLLLLLLRDLGVDVVLLLALLLELLRLCVGKEGVDEGREVGYGVAAFPKSDRFSPFAGR